MESTCTTVAARSDRGKRNPRPVRRPFVPPEIRQECQARGIPPELVAEIRAGMKAEQEAGPCRRRQMREMAWQKLKPRGCWPFWRHGFRAHYGARVDAKDYTVIPCYDELHAEISAEFPEWAQDEYAFFEELLSPCPRLETAAELWARALSAAIGAAESGQLAATAANTDLAADYDF